MNRVVYDAGLLVAADRSDRRTWAAHRLRLELGFMPLVPAPVVAQVSRSANQAQLRRFLASCAIVPFEERDAHEVGKLLARSRTSDVVDAFVVTTALQWRAVILTSDVDDIERLVSASGRNVRVEGA